MARRIFISDIHMGSAASLHPTTGRPYGWLSDGEAQRLAHFLRSPEARACDELFIVGDFLDLWISPIDLAPPTPAEGLERPRITPTEGNRLFVRNCRSRPQVCVPSRKRMLLRRRSRPPAEVLQAPHNQPIVAALAALREAGKTLHYLPGNHDMQVTAADVAPLGMTYHKGPLVDGPFRISHGHERCLFNGPDPRGRRRPFGYYISRFVATAANRSPHGAAFSMWLILRNPDDVLALATGGKTLGEAVYDVVVATAGLREDERILEADGTSIAVGDVRPMFAHLHEEWSAAGCGLAATAVTCEWDPWYGLPIAPKTIAVMGHSHSRVFNYVSESHRIYVNTGAWEQNVAHYAVTWTDTDHAYAALYKWDGAHGVYVNKAGIAV